MPKKLGTCPKSLEARQRRAEKKKEEKEKKEREIEEAYWKDNDKHVNKKLQRKDERDEKRQEQLDKKKEKERLYAQELAEIKSAKASAVKSQPNKLTQAQIASAREALNEQLASLSKKQTKNEMEELPPNVNRMEVDGLEARNVEEAIAVLSTNDGSTTDLDRHPERRLKAAYAAYEEKMMPVLREENPGLRNSQLKQMIFKMFQTAPENPKNQAFGVYNAKN
ncbi:Coiled-coil domain-containing protein 124-A [Fasciola hepatica]|uniref:Coiled-coil domain-containing protein 124-A n=1 Tax=Fasciola hepatica TaxID=6192 RepID=A0A4E0RGN8_FASHE|nr:Coiled-coil domain-containing protein 124-A [Fasciola hepatica]